MPCLACHNLTGRLTSWRTKWFSQLHTIRYCYNMFQYNMISAYSAAVTEAKFNQIFSSQKIYHPSPSWTSYVMPFGRTIDGIIMASHHIVFTRTSLVQVEINNFINTALVCHLFGTCSLKCWHVSFVNPPIGKGEFTNCSFSVHSIISHYYDIVLSANIFRYLTSCVVLLWGHKDEICISWHCAPMGS